jgi:hypothetical protein
MTDQRMIQDLAQNIAAKAIELLDREAKVARVALNPAERASMLNRVCTSITVWMVNYVAIHRTPEADLAMMVRGMIEAHSADLRLNVDQVVALVLASERHADMAMGQRG